MKPTHENQTGHETFIPMLCKLVGARSYLELGVYKGDTLRRVGEENPTCKCLGLDIVDVLVRPTTENIWFYGNCTLEHFSKLNPAMLFDVIFIDASHQAEDVWRDLRNALKHSPEHGLILLHDTYPKDEAATAEGYCGTAWEIAEELADRDNAMNMGVGLDIEAVTLPYHPGLTIIRKRSKHLAW